MLSKNKFCSAVIFVLTVGTASVLSLLTPKATSAQTCAGGASSSFQQYSCSSFYGCVPTTVTESHSCSLYPGLSSCNTSGSCGYCRHPGQTCTQSGTPPNIACNIQQISVNAAGCGGTAQWDNAGCYCSLPPTPPGATPPPGGCVGAAYSGVQGATCTNYGSMAECEAVSNDCKCGSCSGNITYHAVKMAVVYEDGDQDGTWDTATEQRLSGVADWTIYGSPRSCTNAGPLPATTSTYLSGLNLGIDDNWNTASQWVCSIGDDEIPFWLGCGSSGSCDYYAQIEHSCLHDSDCGSWPGSIRRFQPNYATNTINSNQNLKNGPAYMFYTHNIENGGQVHRITVTAPSGWSITQVRKQDGITNPLITPYGCTAQSCNYDVVFDSAPADGCATGCDANFLTVGMRQVPIPTCTMNVVGANIPLNGTRTIYANISTTNQGTVSNVQFTIPAADRTKATFIDNTAFQTPIDPLSVNNASNCTNPGGCAYTLFGYQPNVKGLLATGTTPIIVTAYAQLTDSRVNTNVGPLGNYECSATGTISVNSVAWWQATDADILLNGAFRSSLPTASTRFDLAGPDNIAGIPSYSSVTNADLGLGVYPTAISNQQWVINSNPTLPYPATNTRYDYAYLNNLGPQVTCPSTDLCFNNLNGAAVTIGALEDASTTGSQGYYWFRSTPPTGTLTFQGGMFDIGVRSNNRRYVVYVNGNVVINNDITLASAGRDSLILISNGNLTISPDVTRLDGIFIVGGNLTTGTNQPTTDDQALALNGTAVVWGNTTLQRNLATNLTAPGESFNYKPQLLVSWPQALSRKLTDWKEVNP